MSAKGLTAGRRRVGVFGMYGVGNYGNDEAARAILALLRETDPSVDMTLLAPRAEGATAALGLPAIGFQQEGARRDALSRIGLKLREFRQIFAAVGRFDQVVVAGSGVLQHVRGRWPGGVLVWMLALSVSCRLRRVPLAWFLVGGSAELPRLPRLVAVLAARGASYRSYRDRMSADSLGAVVSHDAVGIDIVFSRPEAARDRCAPTMRPITGRIGVSVMDYDAPDELTRERYLATMLEATRSWRARGHELRFLLGDTADDSMTRWVVDRAYAGEGDPHIVRGPYQQIVEAAADCDVVVASRYHVLIAGALNCRPVVAVSHLEKDDALLVRLGLGDFVVSAERVSFATLDGMVERAIREAAAIETRLSQDVLPELHDVVRAEFLRSGLGTPREVRSPQ